MAEKERQKPAKEPERSQPRERPKRKPGERRYERAEPQGLEIEKADRRGYGQDR